ncbi:MAG TPA: ester cyclase [Streptosporangiaceae bacterium]|nr:ester cyclase [Streptosporangiaceae bacterium]
MAATDAIVTATEANKQTIRALFQAMNEHRAGDLRDYIAADVIDHNKIIHGEADEPGAAFDGFSQQLAAFSDIAMIPQELIAEGNQVVVRVMASGTHTGSHPRMPQPTGRSFEVEQIWIFTLDSGKVTEIRAVSDRLGLFAQLGWDWPS